MAASGQSTGFLSHEHKGFYFVHRAALLHFSPLLLPCVYLCVDGAYITIRSNGRGFHYGGRVGVGVVHMSSQKGADGSTYKDLAEC